MDDGKGKPSNIPKKTKLILGVVTLARWEVGTGGLKSPMLSRRLILIQRSFLLFMASFRLIKGTSLLCQQIMNQAIRNAEERRMFLVLFRRRLMIACEILIQKLYATKITLTTLRQKYIRIIICLGTADGR